MPTTVSTPSELRQAVANASPGSEIVARGGTYDMSSRWTVRSGGEPDAPLVIRAADGQRPHIKFAAGGSQKDDSGIQFRSPHVVFKGFEVSGSGWKGVNAGGNAHHVTFEDLSVHHCNVWGIMNNGNDNVVFRNCDSYSNMDPQNGGQHSDGFTISGPAQNALIEGCRAWDNGDDGFDVWVSENHTIRYCWSWNNGQGENGNGNGFKLGSPQNGGGGHLVHNCVSYGNKVQNNSNSPGSGFWWNGEDDNAIEVYNCTAWDNGIDFAFNDMEHVLRNNVSYQGGVNIGSAVDDAANSWNHDVADPEFQSMDTSSEGFLRPAASSPCRDAGVDVGLSFEGDAPDLGALEYAGDQVDSSQSRLSVDGEATLAASDARTNSESQLQREHAGFNGSGYVNFVPDSGAYAEWPLEVATANEYGFEIRYANGGSASRTVTLSSDGTEQEVTFEPTGGWTSWSTVSGTLALPSGAVDLGIQTIGEDGGNVDELSVWPLQTETPSEPVGDTPNHGYTTPEAGQADWHVPLNENFEAIDRDVPVVDADDARDQYTPAEGTLYIATDTGTFYVGDGNAWNPIGSLN